MLGALIQALRQVRQGQATHAEQDLCASMRPLSGGANNAVYAAEVEGQPIVLKCYRVDRRRRAWKEQAALQLAEAYECVVMPRLLAFSGDEAMPIAALEWLPGAQLASVALNSRQIEALGAALAAIYRLADTAPTDSVDSNVAGRIAAMQRHIAALPVATGTPYMLDYAGSLALESTQEVAALWSAWQASADWAILNTPMPLVFSRGDPNLANCLWDGDIVRVVDFEYAGLSDRALDLADLLEHPNSSATPEDQWQTLLDYLALPAREHKRLEAARRLLQLYWLAKFATFGADDPRYLAQRAAIHR